MPETRQQSEVIYRREPQEELVYRKASFVLSGEGGASAPSTLNIEKRSVGVDLATETPVREFDWEHGIVPTVILMSGAVLPSDGQVPLLDTHNRSSVFFQIGSLREMQPGAATLPATAYFAKSAKAQDVFDLVCDGHLKDISVGRKDLESVFVPQGTTTQVAGKTFTGPVKVVTRWEVKEGSFTSLGADENAKTRAASDGNKNREEPPMSTPEGTKVDGRAEKGAAPNVSTANPPQPAPAAPASSPVQEEKVRSTAVADILLIARTHNCYELAEQAIRSGTTPEAFGLQVLNHLGSQSSQHAPSVMPRAEVTLDGADKFRAAARDALLVRAGSQYAPKELAPGWDELRGYTLKELARECLRMAGQPTGGESFEMVGRAFTTSDFPHVLADVSHKAVLTGAQEAAETFMLWTGEVSASDFREHTGVSLDAFSSLDEVGEDSEYKHAKVSGSGVKYYVVTFGKIFGITRQAIINDNLNVFTGIPAGMGRAAMRTCGNKVYGLLTDNVTLGDGKQLFCADHKNVAATGGKITTDSFSAGVTAMGTHVGKQKEALNIAPHYLLIPIAKQAEALSFLNSQMIGTQAQPNQVNPWHKSVQPIPEARLDMHNPKGWYLAGQKGWAVNCAWLHGNKTPRVEQRAGFTVDAIEHKISLDFGTYVNDYRALFYNAGA